MTDEYIEEHFDEIIEHASDIESRLDDSSCTVQSLKADNQAYIQGCQENGELVTYVDSSFWLTSADDLIYRFSRE